MGREPATASRILTSCLIRPEAHTFAGITATDTDRSAIGAPAGGARHRAVVIELDCTHAAADIPGGHNVMAAVAQPGLDAEWPDILHLDSVSLRPQARSLDRFLEGHPVIDQVAERLHHRGEDAQSTG